MSDLPKYQRIAGDDIQEVSSASASGARPAVATFSFYPVYPIRGSPQHVVGVQHQSLESTIDSARQHFPALHAVDPSRIHLSIPVRDGSIPAPPPPAPHAHAHGHGPAGPACHVRQWARISDEAWPGVQGEELQWVRVEVDDGPGDKKRRVMFYLALALSPMLAMISLMALMVFLVTVFDI